MNAIKLDKVWEKYHVKFINYGEISWEEIWALQDVSFEVNAGEVFGIVGQNGAGKTTLLKLIAGMLIPDRGTIEVNGKVSVLMELGAGFNPEFTGRENIVINSRIYGIGEESLQQRMKDLIKFAGLGKFIDSPIKYYSQGMYMRLAFALAIFVEPDILLIDDILAVGDEEAQQKCIKKIFELKQAGKTIILATHDMSMMSRLSDRAILLEKGRVIKESVPQKVVPAYRETIGDKQGIAVLETDTLRVVFNNGRISIDYEGLPLTKDAGGYLSFFDPPLNAWVSSLNLDWQVDTAGTDKIVAQGASADSKVSQVWTIQLGPETIALQIELKEKVNAPQVDLLLIPEYNHWVNVDTEGDVCPFVSKNNWHLIDAAGCREGVLGMAAAEKKPSPPCLILERADWDGQIKLFNTGYEQEARAIKIYMHSHLVSFTFRLFGDNNKFDEYIKRRQGQFLLKQQEEKSLAIARCTIVDGPNSLFVDVKDKAIKIYHGDKEVTRGKGMYVTMLVAEEKEWIDPLGAQWSVDKISEKELSLTWDYRDLCFRQTCALRWVEDNTLEILISIQSDKALSPIYKYLQFNLSEAYEKWRTAYETGDFYSKQYVNDIVPIRLKDNKVSSIILEHRHDSMLTTFAFYAIASPKELTLSLFKKREENRECVCLTSSIIVPKDTRIMPSQRSDFFKAKINLGSNVALEKDTEDVFCIGQDNINFVFDRGKAKIIWQEKELTQGLGVYTSMRSEGIWYDSYQAIWNMAGSPGGKILVVRGEWPHIPIAQTWRIEVKDNNVIHWDVDMEVYEEIFLEIEQANLMLSAGYKKWLIPGFGGGDFIDEYTQDYDILPFRFWYGNPVNGGLVVGSEGFPQISFGYSGNQEGGNFKGVVENSDVLYQGRLLQYQKTNSVKLSPDKYRYFEGTMVINSNY